MQLLRSVGTWVLAGAVMLFGAGAARAQSGQGKGNSSNSGNSTNSSGGTNSSGSSSSNSAANPNSGANPSGYGGYSASQGAGWPAAGQNSSGLGRNGGLPSPGDSNPGDVPQTQMQMEEQQAKLRNAERQKQLVSDTQKLVALVNELQTDVDKSTKDTLSLDVIRKAEEIEKLAHTVRDRMKNAN